MDADKEIPETAEAAAFAAEQADDRLKRVQILLNRLLIWLRPLCRMGVRNAFLAEVRLNGMIGLMVC
ncbi:hypothetical protein PO124_04405 [Bacillus licheniformis]|nr:hypothetical protein [Bacillus licheniformis]